METIQTLMDAFGELGGTLIAVIVMMVALLLAGLIVRASRATEKTATVQPPKPGNRYHDATAAQQPAVAPVAQPVVESAPDPIPAPAIKPAPVFEPDSQPAQQAAASVSDPRTDAERKAQKAALANPYPTDSVLRRHYETLHNLQPAAAKAEPEVAIAAPPKANKPRGSIIEMAINKDEQAAPAAAKSTSTAVAKPILPQDSVLKRHFIQQLQAGISTEMGPKPTDSVLKRHYEAAARAALEKRLSYWN